LSEYVLVVGVKHCKLDSAVRFAIFHYHANSVFAVYASG